jgi:heptosyltransferase II
LQVVPIGDAERILVLNRNHIGDCILTTPMLRALKRRFPRAQLTVSVPAANRDLVVTNPHVDEILIRPETQTLRTWHRKIQFGFELRRRRFDLIISLQEKSVFYGIVTWYTTLANREGPVTVALDHPRTRRWYQHTVRPELENQHEVYKYLDVAYALGCPKAPNPVLELEPTLSARERAERLLNSEGWDSDTRFIGINPGGTKPDKRWPPERFAEVADRLQEELGLPILIFGGSGDRGRATEIAERMSRPALVAAGRATLGDTAALIERCELFVTGDTGPMHMAVALAVPVVALFGPTNPAKFRPFTGLRTVLRHEKPCPSCTSTCMHTITAEECIEAALGLYSAPPVPGRTERMGVSDGERAV